MPSSPHAGADAMANLGADRRADAGANSFTEFTTDASSYVCAVSDPDAVADCGANTEADRGAGSVYFNKSVTFAHEWNIGACKYYARGLPIRLFSPTPKPTRAEVQDLSVVQISSIPTWMLHRCLLIPYLIRQFVACKDVRFHSYHISCYMIIRISQIREVRDTFSR